MSPVFRLKSLIWRRADVDVVGTGQVAVLGRAEEAVAVGQDLERSVGVDDAAALGMGLQDLEDEFLLLEDHHLFMVQARAGTPSSRSSLKPMLVSSLMERRDAIVRLLGLGGILLGLVEAFLLSDESGNDDGGNPVVIPCFLVMAATLLVVPRVRDAGSVLLVLPGRVIRARGWPLYDALPGRWFGRLFLVFGEIPVSLGRFGLVFRKRFVSEIELGLCLAIFQASCFVRLRLSDDCHCVLRCID